MSQTIFSISAMLVVFVLIGIAVIFVSIQRSRTVDGNDAEERP